MKAKTKPIAVILIRSGSRSLVDKNIKPLAGKPLVFYTIEVAKQRLGIDVSDVVSA